MNLRVIKAGILDTMQDLGRFGHQDLGINPGGAMDKVSAQVANILVGNAATDAVLELHFPASSFFFEEPALIAISGADFHATVNGEEIPHLHPVLLSKYSILQFNGLRSGARAYLAVHGGYKLDPWLGSNSTQLKAAAGGFKGRPLQKDDEIGLLCARAFTLRMPRGEFEVLPWKADDKWDESFAGTMHVLPGSEWEILQAKSRNNFTQHPYSVGFQSDRMGYHLRGVALSRDIKGEFVSSGVNFGTVQLLPDGQLIILMADHQTAGGYPRVAHIITAHLSRLAQLKPGEYIRFRMTTQANAEEALLKQLQHLRQLQHACRFKLEQFFK